MQNQNEHECTLRELLQIFCADVEVCLLRDESQENYLDKLYSKEEIINQLENTLLKTLSISEFKKVYDIPLFSTLTEFALKEEGFSNQEIQKAKKNSYEA
jgi:hypothetical protein